MTLLKQLCLAAKQDDLKTFKELIFDSEVRALLNEDVGNGYTCVYYAIQTNTGTHEVLRFMMNFPELDLFTKAGKKQRTPLEYAIHKKDKIATAILLEEVRRFNIKRLLNHGEEKSDAILDLSPLSKTISSISAFEPEIKNPERTSLLRFPQLYKELHARSESIRNVLLIGPGYSSIISQSSTTFFSFQYLLLAALLPNARFVILEPNQELFTHLQSKRFGIEGVNKYLKSLMLVNEFIYESVEEESQYIEAFNHMSDNFELMLSGGLRPASIIDTEVYNITLGQFESEERFDAIVATHSIIYSLLHNKENIPVYHSKISKLLSDTGEIYVDPPTRHLFSSVVEHARTVETIIRPPCTPFAEDSINGGSMTFYYRCYPSKEQQLNDLMYGENQDATPETIISDKISKNTTTSELYKIKF